MSNSSYLLQLAFRVGLCDYNRVVPDGKTGGITCRTKLEGGRGEGERGERGEGERGREGGGGRERRGGVD